MNLDNEIWKDVEGFEGVYKISNLGRLKSFKVLPKLGYTLSNVNKKGGYFSVVLRSGDKVRYTRIHRMVAESFVENSQNKKTVNHIDGDKQNNRADNLEWTTQKENCDHAREHGLTNVKGMSYYNRFTRPKTVLQFTLDGKFIDRYANCKLAADSSGVCHRNISQVARGDEYKPNMTRKQAGGYVWKFEEAI